MNCLFCQQPLNQEAIHCQTTACKEAKVVYFYGEIFPTLKNLHKVGFQGMAFGKTFFIDYIVQPRSKEKLCCQIKIIYTDKEGGCGFRTILTLPYPPLILTPTNCQSRLPTLIAFS